MLPPKILSQRLGRLLTWPALLFAVLFVSPAMIVFAQGVGSSRGEIAGTGGHHSIQGKIYFLGDKPAKMNFRVRLESTNSTTLFTNTDHDGGFNFNGLAPGPYVITVEGNNDFESSVERIEIDRAANSPVYVVPVYLRPNPRAALVGVPQAAADLYLNGLEAVRKGNGNNAIEQFTSAIHLYPQFGLAFNELGTQYLRAGQADKAAEAFQSAVKFKPEAFSPRLNLGIALLNKNDFAGAETQLREALKRNDASPLAHLYLGVVLAKLHKYDEAESELQRSTSMGKSEVSMAHKYLGGLYWSKKEYKRAADELEKYLELSPKAPDAERVRGTVKELRSKS